MTAKTLLAWDTRGYIYTTDHDSITAVCDIGGRDDPSAFAGVFVRFDSRGDLVHAIGIEHVVPYMDAVGFEIISESEGRP